MRFHDCMKIIAMTGLLSAGSPVFAQQPDQLWGQNAEAGKGEKTRWFTEAKFGLFLHWGPYAHFGGDIRGKRYYGITEWIMNRDKTPAAEYARLAGGFNPVEFDAEEWVRIAKASGVKYIVLTAKHHDGFAMWDSKVSDFDIVDATPYKKDPIKALAAACKKEGIKLGFYYSQFQDWHEPNGGGNSWDFDPKKKDYAAYYRGKSLPQITELLSNYGELGIIWFDTPGNMNKEESAAFLEKVHQLQPNCLVSSRVGNGLGDFKDFGDGEVPAGVVKGAWEAIFTHNDSWGYSAFDQNFKTPQEIIRLLAEVASKGGNLMMNIGPMGNGKLPALSEKYFRATGDWLKVNGEAVYGTGYSPIAPQPWGVMTHKPGKLYLHVFHRPHNGKLLLPDFTAKAVKASLLAGKKPLTMRQQGKDVYINLPATLPDERNTVVVLDYSGELKEQPQTPQVISTQFERLSLPAQGASLNGNAQTKSLTHSYYFGDWKHAMCIVNQQSVADSISYRLRFTEPGDYKVVLQYSADTANERREGLLELIPAGKAMQEYPFQVLLTGKHDTHKPLLFIDQAVAVITVPVPGEWTLRVRPAKDGKELFRLKQVLLEPLK
ncbi:alpha-L-fucosidase [Chitinophaga sp. GCM10012297]|uniref:alpha-L-fucosidase n=1 Tax=Chitinophaga chungangae TaxID=2821488 RepID=A0ABS3YIH3_9BACT|nr:alpha-L-fucosidase [Chitinophaga chungangae]MBO9154490.1 alpha-L-fucosidase [Chitinophaga chungangae]